MLYLNKGNRHPNTPFLRKYKLLYLQFNLNPSAVRPFAGTVGQLGCYTVSVLTSSQSPECDVGWAPWGILIINSAKYFNSTQTSYEGYRNSGKRVGSSVTHLVRTTSFRLLCLLCI